MISKDLLKEAFRKLLTYTYFDKTDMAMRMRAAEFARSLSDFAQEEEVFGDLAAVANGDKKELLDNWVSRVELCYYPKKVSNTKPVDERLITNVPPKDSIEERLLIKADIPVELCILDVAWILTYGYKVDSDLSDDSWGNRLDLIGVKKGNALFKKYQNQYGEWWRRGLRAANSKQPILTYCRKK